MNIFVGCASRNTENENYNKIAENLGNFIVAGKHNYVFGGAETGLMGKIFSIVSKSADSKIIINMAKAYADESKNLSYNETYLFDTVNERKNAFIKLADVMVFLPGGIGTIDELLSAIESRRNGEHNIPVIIVNTNNFFGHLLEMFNKIYDEGFANKNNSELYYVTETLEDALNQLRLVKNNK